MSRETLQFSALDRNGSFARKAVRGLLVSVLALLISVTAGCKKDESDDGTSPRSYAPPGEGHTAIITIEHLLAEQNSDAYSDVRVTLLVNAQRIIGADVYFNGVPLAYDSRVSAFTDVIEPPLLPNTVYTVYARSLSWGEDSTHVRLPGSFNLTNVHLDSLFHPGDTIHFSWESSAFAQRYLLTIGASSEQAMLDTTLVVTSCDWTVPDGAAGRQLRLVLAAERTIDQPPIYSGTSSVRRERTLTFGS